MHALNLCHVSQLTFLAPPTPKPPTPKPPTPPPKPPSKTVTIYCINRFTPLAPPGPKACLVSQWTTWSTCSTTCNDGTQTATRTITQQGDHCPPLTRTRSCHEKPCSIATLKLNTLEETVPEGYPVFDPYRLHNDHLIFYLLNCHCSETASSTQASEPAQASE